MNEISVWAMKIDYVCDKEGSMTGLSRYAYSLYKELRRREDIRIVHVSPSRLGSLRLLGPLRKYIKSMQQKGDIVHFTSQTVFYPLIFRRYSNTVITVHDLVELSAFNSFDDNPRLRFSFIDKMINRWAMKKLSKADRLIAISKHTKKDIRRYIDYPEDRIDVVHYGVDHDKFRRLYADGLSRAALKGFSWKDGKKSILYVGSEHPRKNFMLLLKAFNELRKKIDARLIKVGEHEWKKGREEADRFIRKNGLEKHVIFAGYVGGNLPKYYNAADLFVFPSLYEGFGLPPLEAMACGCPVICSDQTSLPEVVGNGALMFNPRSKDAVRKLANKMFMVLTDDKLSEELAVKGIERAKHFTWAKCAEETIRSYKKIII